MTWTTPTAPLSTLQRVLRSGCHDIKHKTGKLQTLIMRIMSFYFSPHGLGSGENCTLYVLIWMENKTLGKMKFCMILFYIFPNNKKNVYSGNKSKRSSTSCTEYIIEMTILLFMLHASCFMITSHICCPSCPATSIVSTFTECISCTIFSLPMIHSTRLL